VLTIERLLTLPQFPYRATYRDLNVFDRVLFFDNQRRRVFASGEVDAVLELSGVGAGGV
jgi:hypothetical protein